MLDGENIFISTSMPNGKGGQSYLVIKYYNGKCSFGDLLSRLIFKNNYHNKLNLKYLSYYLNSIKIYLESFYEKGSCNKSLDTKNFLRMKIPIPSMKMQQAYVKSISDMVGRQLQIDTIDHKLSKINSKL